MAQFSFYSHVSQLLAIVVAMRLSSAKQESHFSAPRRMLTTRLKNKLMTKCRRRNMTFRI